MCSPLITNPYYIHTHTYQLKSQTIKIHLFPFLEEACHVPSLAAVEVAFPYPAEVAVPFHPLHVLVRLPILKFKTIKVIRNISHEIEHTSYAQINTKTKLTHRSTNRRNRHIRRRNRHTPSTNTPCHTRSTRPHLLCLIT